LLPPEVEEARPAAVKWRCVRKLTTTGRDESKACGGKIGEEREAYYRRKR